MGCECALHVGGQDSIWHHLVHQAPQKAKPLNMPLSNRTNCGYLDTLYLERSKIVYIQAACKRTKNTLAMLISDRWWVKWILNFLSKTKCNWFPIPTYHLSREELLLFCKYVPLLLDTYVGKKSFCSINELKSNLWAIVVAQKIRLKPCMQLT